jgi:hypothetical protein
MRFLSLIRAVLREIFEESAYERFCAQEGVIPGRDSYARFLSRAEKGIKVKCC